MSIFSGPLSIPILGSIPFLPKKSLINRVALADYMADTWGEVSCLYIANNLVVYISDAEVARKVLKMEEASGRPASKPLSQLRFGKGDGKSRGILFSTDKEWREQRRFSMKTLKDMGFGKSSMEDSINSEVLKLVELLKENSGESVELRSLMNLSIVNSLWMLMSGEVLDLKDSKLKEFISMFDKCVQGGGAPNPVLSVFGVWAVDIFDKKFQFAKNTVRDIKRWIAHHISDHKNAINLDWAQDTYITEYLKQIQKTSDPESSFHTKKGEESMITACFDLFVAGLETTTSTLVWGILFLLHNHEIQRKVHFELDNALGDRKTVNFDDRSKLPYTCAVINEIHRKASIVHSNLPHAAKEDLKINGFIIPKGAMILTNMIRIHHDEKNWNNPHKFHPERFIDQDSHLCIGDVNLMPFSVGKRYCLGQSLAEKEVFMFFVGLMKAFEFVGPEGHSLPDCGYHSGQSQSVIRTPPEYKVIIKQR